MMAGMGLDIPPHELPTLSPETTEYCCYSSDMQSRVEQEVQELFRIFRWKKYGNKEIKGGPICRGYYFCRTCGVKLKIDYVKRVTYNGEEINTIRKWELEDPKCHLPECTDHVNRMHLMDSSDCSGVNNFQLLVDAAVDAYQGLDEDHHQHSDFEADQLELHSLEKSSCQTHSTIPEVEPRSEPPNTQIAARQAAAALIKRPLSTSTPTPTPSVQISPNRKRKQRHDRSLLFEYYGDSEYEIEGDEADQQEYGLHVKDGKEFEVKQEECEEGHYDEGINEQDYYDDEEQYTYSDEKMCDADSDEYQPPTRHTSFYQKRGEQVSLEVKLQQNSQDRLILQQFQSNERKTVLVSKENMKQYEALEAYGYRKYGQKDIQGSVYPRSYHRCNRESCPARKQVQQIDGTTYQISYLYQHDHQPLDQAMRHRRNKRARNLNRSSRKKPSRQMTPKKKRKQQPVQSSYSQPQAQRRAQIQMEQQQSKYSLQQQSPQLSPQQNLAQKLYQYHALPVNLQDKLLHSAMQLATTQSYLNSQQGMLVNSILGHREQRNHHLQYSPNSTLHLPSTINACMMREVQDREREQQQKQASALLQLFKETRESRNSFQQLYQFKQYPWCESERRNSLELQRITLNCRDQSMSGIKQELQYNCADSERDTTSLHMQHRNDQGQKQSDRSSPSLIMAAQDLLQKAPDIEKEE